MNPPYGTGIGAWVRKAYESALLGATVVCLVPARTDTRWWQDCCTKGRCDSYEAVSVSTTPTLLHFRLRWSCLATRIATRRA